MAADDVLHRGPTTFVWHVHKVDAGRELEQFAAEMLEASHAGRRIVEFAGLLFGQRNQFLDGIHRKRRIDRENIGSGCKNRNWGK